MPYVLNNNIRVRYESAGDRRRPAIVLVFGMGMTCEDWVELGYVDRLAGHFHVVSVEPRGHGRSSRPVDPADYGLSAMASDIAAVIGALKLAKPVLWGYSLGAKIALAAAGRMPSACSGLVLGGFELHSNVDVSADLVLETLAGGPLAWRALWKDMFAVPDGMWARLADLDTSALSALRRAEAGWPSLEAVAAGIQVPVLLYAADGCFFRDATAAAARAFADARYVEHAGCNHFDLMPESDWIADMVAETFGGGPVRSG